MDWGGFEGMGVGSRGLSVDWHRIGGGLAWAWRWTCRKSGAILRGAEGEIGLGFVIRRSGRLDDGTLWRYVRGMSPWYVWGYVRDEQVGSQYDSAR